MDLLRSVLIRRWGTVTVDGPLGTVLISQPIIVAHIRLTLGGRDATLAVLLVASVPAFFANRALTFAGRTALWQIHYAPSKGS